MADFTEERVFLVDLNYKDDHKLNRIDEERYSEENMGSINSRKKSRHSNNHSRVSSKTSKDMSITKLKAYGEKRHTLFDNPIQEVADQEIKSNPSANENKEEMSPIRVEGINEQRRNSNLPISLKLTSKIKNKYNKSFSKPANKKEDKNLKNSNISIKADNVSISVKNSPSDRKDTKDLGIEREKFKTFHVQKLISSLKKSSGSMRHSHIDQETGSQTARPESSLSKFITSQTGQVNSTSQASGAPTKPKAGYHKVGAHRRTYSDTNSLHYQKASKGINSARNRNVFQETNAKPQKISTMPSQSKNTDENKSTKGNLSTRSMKSSTQANYQNIPNPGDNHDFEESPIGDTHTDFLKKHNPKTVFTLGQVPVISQEDHYRVVDDNKALRLENAEQKKVAVINPENQGARGQDHQVSVSCQGHGDEYQRSERLD